MQELRRRIVLYRYRANMILYRGEPLSGLEIITDWFCGVFSVMNDKKVLSIGSGVLVRLKENDSVVIDT